MLSRYLYVGSLAFSATQRLVDHHLRVWQNEALAFCSCRKKPRGTGCRDTNAHRRDVGFYVIHGVYHRECRRHRTAGGVYVKRYVLFWVFRGEEKELCDNKVLDIAVYRPAQEHDA